MRTYGFTLILKGQFELAEEVAERLYTAGCGDGRPEMRNRELTIHFRREATSLEAAIRSATNQVKATGLDVDRAEIVEASIPSEHEILTGGIDQPKRRRWGFIAWTLFIVAAVEALIAVGYVVAMIWLNPQNAWGGFVVFFYAYVPAVITAFVGLVAIVGYGVYRLIRWLVRPRGSE